MKRFFVLCFALCPALLHAQDAGLREAKANVSILFRVLLPEGLREGWIMREYLGSDSFIRETAGEGDRERMDDIYYDALALAHGDRTRGLLGAALGVFEHKTIPLEILGLIVPIPLTSESQAHFDHRVSQLPIHLYSNQRNDVDKLQHFFSSAWLKHAFGMDWLVNLAGNFVEVGEEAFVLGGSNDPRDKHANHDGLVFGMNLGEGDDVPPSTYLTPNP